MSERDIAAHLLRLLSTPCAGLPYHSQHAGELYPGETLVDERKDKLRESDVLEVEHLRLVCETVWSDAVEVVAGELVGGRDVGAQRVQDGG